MLLIEEVSAGHFYVTTTQPIADFSDLFSDIPDGVYFSDLQSIQSPTLKGGWIFPCKAKPLVEERIKIIPVETQSADDEDDGSVLSISDLLQELSDRLTALEEIVYSRPSE